MACNFRLPPVVCSTQSKPDFTRKKPSSSSAWWTPLFGISSGHPDYIQSSGNLKKEPGYAISGQLEGETGRPRSKFALGCFTEEKAKELRRKTIETSTFHDIMYHSVIASRLASNVWGRQER